MEMLSKLMVLVVIYGFAWLWSAILLGVGVCHIQRLSTGGAVGTVILSFLIPFILFFGLLMMLGALGAAAGAH